VPERFINIGDQLFLAEFGGDAFGLGHQGDIKRRWQEIISISSTAGNNPPLPVVANGEWAASVLLRVSAWLR
jgi:hypothetical protein